MEIDLRLLQNSTAAMIYCCTDKETKKALKKHLCTIELMIETRDKNKALNIGNVSKRYLIEVHTNNGNRLQEAISYDKHQAECIYEQAKEDYSGYKVTKIEIPNVC